MQFTILTYNMHKGFAYFGWHFKLHKMRDAIIEQNADMVFLQEIYGEHKQRKARIENWPDEPHLNYLAYPHWPYHTYAKNAVYRNGHHGNGVMTKFPLVKCENINVALNKFSSRSLLHTSVQINNKLLHTICVHLGLFEKERQKQFSILAERIKSHVPDNEALIIAGDFNDWRQRADEHLCATLNLRDAFIEKMGETPKTYPAAHPLFAMDRIYYRGLKLLDCECIENKTWRYLSDHLPLKARMEITC